MKGDDLKNWLAVLGIGGGLAIAGPDMARGDAANPQPEPGSELPRAERREGPVYVVINHEEQYSIWPAMDEVPRGWKVMHGKIDLAGAVKRFPRIGDQRFRVVINHEEQYSIWPQGRRLPKGYKLTAMMKERETCRIDECGRLLEELGDGGGGR